jgi:transcriptional regulator with XRE-family HTH domain
MTAEEPSGQRQELAAELRRTRLLAGLSHGEVANQTGLSESNVSELESGQALPSLDEVHQWSYAVGASKRASEQLVALTEAVATEVTALRPWLQAGFVAAQEDIGRLEAAAAAVRSCEPFLVPGLLQTREYAKQILNTFARPMAELEAVVSARFARQAVVHDPSRRFEFLVTDYGLRWAPLGTPRAVLTAQISHINELAQLPNVSVGVIWGGVQTKVPLAPFSHYEGVEVKGSTGRIDIVMTETPTSMIVVTDPADVRNYANHFAWLREAADFGPEAVNRVRARKH